VSKFRAWLASIESESGNLQLKTRPGRPFSLPRPGGAVICRLGGGLRSVMQGPASASPLAITCMMAGIFIAHTWAPLPNESRALSGTAPGPQFAESRTTAQRARTLRIAAGSNHIGNLQSIQPSTTIGVPPPALCTLSDQP
jgi:hypothetical protein